MTTASPQQSSVVLLRTLADVLPEGYRFGVHHLSTPPTRCDALCSPPPDERPDRTYRESHFLAVSIEAPATPGDEAKAEARPVLVLALEIFVFTTAFSSVFFVSKADSTGYLHLLGLPRGAPSPIREVSAAFVAYLVEQRRRDGLQCVVSLFARAQSQYLFPGSADNGAKHVLDDRGLVRWWCRVLDPLVERPPAAGRADWAAVKAYLVVPGLDKYETRAFLPRTPSGAANWVLGHPMDKISHYTREYDWVPARCLIPRYPDDPKSRFRDDLDEEAAKSKILLTTGSWRSVTTVDQFWELMAYRQECSSGRLTGFIWVVLDPNAPDGPTTASANTMPTPRDSFDASGATPAAAPATPTKQNSTRIATPLTTPRKLFSAAPAADGTPTKTKSYDAKKMKKNRQKKKALSGNIRPRRPHVKTEQRNYLLDRPTTTAYYHWPAEGRGQRIVDDSDYKRSVELLLHLNFANLAIATGSTKRWLGEVGMGAKWDLEVVGRRAIAAPAPAANGSAAATTTTPVVNVLTSMVKRKRADPAAQNGVEEPAAKVNVLGAGLVRKKPKEQNGTARDDRRVRSEAPAAANAAPTVNVLGAGLVRKKPKA